MVMGLLWFLALQYADAQRQSDSRQRGDLLVALARAEAEVARLGTSLATLEQSRADYLASRDSATLGRLQAERAAVQREAAALVGSLPDGASGQALTALRQAIDADAPYLAPDGLSDRHDHLSRLVSAAMRRGEAEVERAEAEAEITAFATWTAGLVVFLLVLTLLMRLVAHALDQVITAAQALDAGRYREVELAPDRAPNHEMEQLARTFGHLAASIEAREQQLQQDVVRLTELERLKRDFVSTVSHELRTPLTSMRGALGLIAGGTVGTVPPKVDELLRIATTNTERLIRLVNDILDVEKVDAGHLEMRRDPVAVAAVLRQTLAGLEALARDAGVSLQLADDATGVVLGDSDRLVQVFTNLVSNAIRHSPTGAAVEVATTMGTASVRVSVRDRGPGIPPEFASRIFGRFEQAGAVEERRQGGTGLGLNIARSLVERHGGRIGYEDAPGGGTTFWVELPTTVPPTSV
jgi:signal transduction histidine kinase